MPGPILPDPVIYPLSTSLKSASSHCYHIEISDMDGVAGCMIDMLPCVGNERAVSSSVLSSVWSD